MAKQLDEILKDIDSGLTDDKEKNIEFLTACSKKYQGEPNQIEIQRHIGRLISANLRDDVKNDFADEYAKSLKSLNETLERAKQLVMSKDFAAANKLLVDHQLDEGLADNVIADDSVTTYLNFDNPIEEAYYTSKFHPEKTVRDIGIPFRLSYSIAAYLATENKDFTKASRILENGIKRCPFAPDLIFEQMEIYKMTKKLDELKALLDSTSGYWYRRIDIAHYFRKLGWYYAELKDWEGAIACNAVSVVYEEHPMVKNELTWIHQQSQMPVENLEEFLHDYHRCKAVLEAHKLQTLPTDPHLIRLFIYFAEQMEQKENFAGAAQCYAILFDLLQDEQFKNKFERCLGLFQSQEQEAQAPSA